MRLFGLEIRRETSQPKQMTGIGMFGGGMVAGVRVTEEASLGFAAVFACVQVLSRAVATLPLHTYRRDSSGIKRIAQDHPIYPILHDAPNPLTTSYKFRETMMGHLCLWGNAYAEIVRNGKGQVAELWPLPPNYVLPKIDDNGRLFYEVRIPGCELVKLSSEKVFHVRGFGTDPLVGKSPIQVCRESIGTGMAVDKWGNSFFANGARVSGVLTTQTALKPEAKERLKKQFEGFNTGLSNAHRVALLEEGVDYKQLGMAPADAEFLNTKRFSVEEAARIFDVPLYKIQSPQAGNGWGAAIEAAGISFVVDNLSSWLQNWEQEINKSLILPSERATIYVKFMVDALLRGDSASRHTAYSIGHQNGYYSANDIREKEDMNPIEGGDVYLLPLNMAPAADVINGTAQAKQGANNDPVQKAPPKTRRSIDDAVPTLKPALSDAIARLIRRARADLGRKLTADISGSVDIVTQYVNTDWSQFAIQTVQPIYTGLSASIGTDNNLVWSAEMVGRLAKEIIDTSTLALDSSQNASASVDGVLVAIGNRSMEIAETELSLVVDSVANTGETQQ